MTSQEVAKWEVHLLEVMKSTRFLNMEGLGGELPSYIYPFDPADGLEVAASRKRIKNKLAQEGIEVLEVNLYELVIELLKARGVLEDLIELEPTIGKDDFLSGLVSMLNPTEDIAPAIRAILSEQAHDICFLTGIGEVFPYIRAHNILNNLQAMPLDRPLVTFFPGRYERNESLGMSLVLFGMLKSDNYYRARDIREAYA